MNNTPLLVVTFLILSAGAVAAQNQSIDVTAYSVTCQGLICEEHAAHAVRSPGGAYTMTISPIRGDFHYLEVDLTVTSAAGHQVRLPHVVGNAFFVSDAGRIVAIETDHPTVNPSLLRILDLSGHELMKRRVDRLSDPVLSADGARLAYRSMDGIVVIDLRDLEETMHPRFDLFAIGPEGLLAGIKNGTDLRVIGDQGELASICLDRRPNCIAFSWDGSSILVLDRGALVRFGIPDGERETLLTAGDADQLRDLRVTASAIHVGLRRNDAETYTGELITLRPDGQVIERRQGTTKQIPSAEGLPLTSRGIPWPLQPNAQHPVGNTYGEYQNYGSPYPHPGADVMGSPSQPVFAVANGVVKAILTTGGEWHWRIAVGEPTGGTSVGYLYAHIDQPSITVDVGDPVIVGQHLGDLVPWPIYDFTHCHFARIEDTGYQWSGDWLCTDNPHLDLQNQTETAAPVFEPAVGNNLLAFCENETSTYLNPTALQGDVDIIAHVGDRIVSDWVCTVQDIRYTIYPVGNPDFPIVDNKLAVNFDMALDTYQGGPNDPFLVELLYKQDSTCRTYGDYDRREFFHILTNSNGDQIYDDIDVWEAWYTSMLPDGDYMIRVTARDVVGNATTDSMVVTTNNGNPISVGPVGESPALMLRSYPNPAVGEAFVSFSLPATDRVHLSVYDPAGRLVRELLDAEVPKGMHSAWWDGRDARGTDMPSGVYLYRLATSTGTRPEVFVLMRR